MRVLTTGYVDHRLAEIDTDTDRGPQCRQQISRRATKLEHACAIRDEKAQVAKVVCVEIRRPAPPCGALRRQSISESPNSSLARRRVRHHSSANAASPDRRPRASTGRSKHARYDPLDGPRWTDLLPCPRCPHGSSFHEPGARPTRDRLVAACDSNQAYVARMPSLKLMVGRQPRAKMRVQSTRLRGVPSGFGGSNTMFPAKPTTSLINRAKSRIEMSLPLPMLMISASS